MFHSDCWTLTTVSFLTGCLWDYQVVITETRWFTCQDPIGYNDWVKASHWSSMSVLRRKTITRPSIVFPLSSHEATDTYMQWWMLFITKAWNCKWSRMSALGSNLWLKHILPYAEASETCWSTPTFPWSYILQFVTLCHMHVRLKSDTASLLCNFLFFCLCLAFSHIYKC